jgi:hypothetical protein
VINAIRDGVKSASNDPLMPGTTPIPAGRAVGGRFFPLLSDAAMAGSAE